MKKQQAIGLAILLFIAAGTAFLASSMPTPPVIEGTVLGEWDFNHDGVPETAELTANTEDVPGATFWVLSVLDENGETLWSDSAATSHAGWNTIAACQVDGKDYLLRYVPGMWQGWADYTYCLFSLDSAGEEVPLQENSVELDLNFRMDGHSFDTTVITDFLWEIRGYLADSTLLLSTEDGEFQSNVPGLELRYFPFGELLSLDSREATEAAVRQMEADWRAEQGA